jgi:hypothetical protein
MSDDLKPYLLIAAALAIFVALWFLGAMFHCEAVKQDLCERGCEPLRIWWRPFAYWATGWWRTPFRVIYRDTEGRLHKAYCCVYKDLTDSPFGPRRVEWIRDELRDFIDV